MTAQSKTTVKSYFETGDKPTQAQFVDLIDSYQDAAANLGTLSSAGLGAVGLAVLATVTTAAAQAALGGGTVGRNVFQATTSAAALSSMGLPTTATGTGALVQQVSAALTNPDITKPNIIGTATNDNAAAGSVGQITESTVLAGAAVALTSNVAANITSISLTAGDWDVWGNIAFAAASSTTVSQITGCINTTSATVPTVPNGGGVMTFQLTFTPSVTQTMPVGMMRISVASTTTVYLVGLATFAVSTMGAYGYIGARRRR